MNSNISKNLNCISASSLLDFWYLFHESDSEHIALSDANAVLTRAQVEKQSGKIYSYLKTQNIGKEDFVFINLSRGVLPFIAALGIIKAGAAFVIFEADQPAERAEQIVKDCKCKLILTDELISQILVNEPYIKGFEVADVHDAAYAVYTSGTTGAPKGVIHERGNIEFAKLSHEDRGKLYENEDTRFGVIIPLNFVATNLIFTIWVYSGAALFIPNYNIVKNPHELADYLQENNINETFMPPSMLRVLIKHLPPVLECIITGSAPADGIDGSKHYIKNLYMSSESGFVIAKHKIGVPASPCPVGKGNQCVSYRIAKTGEIEVQLPFTRGYLDNSLTKETYVGDGFYRTGDLAEFDKDKNLILRGRTSDMIKIDGNRIEPAEIESTFYTITNIKCVAKGFEDADDSFIALYYASDSEIDTESVHTQMANKLPYYMIPSHFIKIDKIPLTQVGKVDRKALPKPVATHTAYVAPSTKLECQFCNIAQDVLQIKRIGINDDFFELGGRSIDVIEMIAKLNIAGLDAEHFYRGRKIAKIIELYEIDFNAGIMTEEEKELEGRKNPQPMPFTASFLYWERVAAPGSTALNLSRAFRLKKTVNLKKLCDAFNTYMDSSSMFKTTCFLGKDKQPRFKYSPELFKPIEIEEVSEEEIDKLRKTFVQPFDANDKLFYRIRILKTNRCGYLFYDMHHIITDGEGQALLFQDIVDLYLDRQAKKSNFFAWLYEENNFAQSKNYQMLLEQANLHAQQFDWSMNVFDNNVNPINFYDFYETGISLNALNKYLDFHKISRGILFFSAMLLENAHFTGSLEVFTEFMYSGRIGIDNHAGVRAKTLTPIINLENVTTITQLYSLVKKTLESAVSVSATYFISPDSRNKAFALDDLGDIEEIPLAAKMFFEQIKLERPYDSVKAEAQAEPVKLICLVNQGKKLNIRIRLSHAFITQENCKAYVKGFIECLKRLLSEDESIIAECKQLN
ncbi:MAG: AMP-binding protein [Coriobacteriales bacterium]|nr:AMP-binding protein [Coriobacteriales bacterium]